MDKAIRFRSEYLKDWSLLGYLLVGILIGFYAILLPFPLSLLGIAGLFVVYASLVKPEVGVLIIVVLVSSIIFEESLPLIPIGVGSLQVSDLLLVALLGKIIFNMIVKAVPMVKSPLNRPLLLFFGTALVSAVLAVTRFGVDFTMVIRNVRGLTYYLLFFVITAHIRSKSQLRFMIKALSGIAVFVALAMLAQAVVGDAVQLMPGRIEQAGTFNSSYEVLRILPPGQTMVYVFLIVTCCMLVIGNRPLLFRSPSMYAALLLGTGVLLTYNRVYWVAIILAALVLALLVSRRERKNLLSLVTLLFGVMVATSVAFATLGGKYSETASSIQERFTSLFAGKELAESSPLEDRFLENRYALRTIVQHPILGVGLGNRYRPAIYGEEDNITYYVHNGYLWLMKDMGPAGPLFFLWFFLGYIVRGIKHIRLIRDDYFRGAAAGFVLAAIGVLPMTFFNPLPMQWFSITVIAIMMGLTEGIIRNNSIDLNEQPLQKQG